MPYIPPLKQVGFTAYYHKIMDLEDDEINNEEIQGTEVGLCPLCNTELVKQGQEYLCSNPECTYKEVIKEEI